METLIAVIDGKVKAACVVGYHDGFLEEAMAEPGFQAVLKVPAEFARARLLEDWPELNSILASTREAA